jgi:tight adherence protein C
VNPALLLSLAAGALIGAAISAVIIAFTPSHPHLADAVAALDERRHRAVRNTPSPSGWRAGAAAAALPMLRRLPGTVDEADLALLGVDHDRFLLGRATAALTYAAVGPALAVVTMLAGVALPAVVPLGFAVAGGLVGWTGYTSRITERADQARLELRFALVAFLQQVSLLRRGGAGVATALQVPARLLADSWAMRRLGDELDLAQRAGQMPWEGLRRFGDRIDVPDLADLSAIAATAGHDGGAVISTLLARAESLHDELLADEHAEANRASSRLSTPGALQVFIIAAWVLYPAVVALLSTT